MRLVAGYTSQFKRDTKRLEKRHVDLEPLYELVDLVLLNTPEAIETLKQHHNMHRLSGQWAGSNECHIANSGDWLVIWATGNGLAVFQRTGSHDEVFRKS